MINEFALAAEFIDGRNNFLIMTHVNPDGDATGSSFALLEYLKEAGKKATLLFPEQLQQRLQSIAEGMDFVTDFAECSNIENIILLDCASPKRVACGDFDYENSGLPILNIDHHIDNSVNFAEVSLVVPEAAATGEILYYLFESMPGEISQKTANYLLLSISDDTGGFRFGNTKPNTLRAAAALQESGADLTTINQLLFFNKPLNLIRFNADLVANHLQTACNGRYAFLVITPEIISRYNLGTGDTDEAIEQLRNIAGTDIVSVMQIKNGICKASLRSKNPRYPVGPIARKFNGGGHEMASGCSFETTDLNQAQTILQNEIIERLNS